MVRSRVLSFMSAFGSSPKDSPRNSPSPQPQSQARLRADTTPSSSKEFSASREYVPIPESPTGSTPSHTPPKIVQPPPSSRPGSILFQQPPMETTRNTEPELIPIFQYLNSHANKLYQEGYFLKLNDLDTNGKPNVDRNWTECFAQLVGTVLSLWDAAALDKAGQDGEVAPTFVNLADASIKMIETLPTRNQDVQPLQNVLSISTAGKNRYLLHFNSLHSLTQWTAGIRLAMFEHASLQELYTGSLIAGKGKKLNNIKVIMERSKFKTEDWARVRFGAGTPWRRCWCVIEPPDEKDYQKLQKTIKKRSAYEKPPVLKGDIKFYDTKKTKKAMPIATITDAYSAYAIYPQAKPLIDPSTLVKVEGRITIHSKPESKTEGFVFVMPEVHPAVTGFEIMLRWLFPVYDTFSLYGRPRQLIADTLDTRGLMFAMPRQRRYGYLEIIDVAGLIHTDGSKDWSEREWRKQMKELTSRRMEMMRAAPTRDGTMSQLGSRNGPRNSLPSRPGNLRFEDNASVRSSPSINHHQNSSAEAVFVTPNKAETAQSGLPFSVPTQNYHQRAVSESVATPPPSRSRPQRDAYVPTRLSTDQEAIEMQAAPAPPTYRLPSRNGRPSLEGQRLRTSSESDQRRQAPRAAPEDITQDLKATAPPTPVAEPPAFIHHSGDAPARRPLAPSDMRHQNSRMSTATLSQMVDATGMKPINGEVAVAGAAAAWKTRGAGRGEDRGAQGVIETLPRDEMTANEDVLSEGLVTNMPVDERTAVDREPRHDLLEPPPNQTRSSSEKSITRKPLPNHQAPLLPQHLPEHAEIERKIPEGKPPLPERGLIDDKVTNAFHQNEDHGAVDEDQISNDSPDYASTRKSTDTSEPDKSTDRPRSGVLKSVGRPEVNETAPSYTNSFPNIDFEPTQSLTPLTGSRPTTPGQLLSEQRSRTPTPGQLAIEPRSLRGVQPQDRPVSRTLTNEQRQSYYGRGSPVEGPSSRPSPHSRSSSSEIRTLAWQPGSTIGAGRQSPGTTITPEEFVQRRASLNRTPSGYVPQRSRSSGYFPVDRPVSAEWLNRPQPRSQSPMVTTQQDYSTHLSAREQEHVARMTGSPLINVPRRSETLGAPAGLVGAIQAREQERKNMRVGVSGQMVQHAIAMRNQQSQAQAQAQTQAQAQQAAFMAYGYSQQHPSIYNRRSLSSSSPMLASQQQIHENSQWTSPPTQTYSGEMLQQQNSQGYLQHQRQYSGYQTPQDGAQR